MSVMILVIVAHLVSGSYNYAAEDVDNLEQCHSRAAEIAFARLEENKAEEDKVAKFDFKCVEFEKPAAKKHVPGKDEA
jgi:hypothetical protein